MAQRYDNCDNFAVSSWCAQTFSFVRLEARHPHQHFHHRHHHHHHVTLGARHPHQQIHHYHHCNYHLHHHYLPLEARHPHHPQQHPHYQAANDQEEELKRVQQVPAGVAVVQGEPQLAELLHLRHKLAHCHLHYIGALVAD